MGRARRIAGRLRARARSLAARRDRLDPRTVLGPAFPPDLLPPPPSTWAGYGDNSWIAPPATVEGNERIEVGSGVIVLEGVRLTTHGAGRIEVGDRVSLARFVSVEAAQLVRLGDGVMTSDGVAITDTFGRADGRSPAGPTPPLPEMVDVRAGAYLGANSVIGPGVTIGEGAFVGEGAVVLQDVAPHTVVYGNPAREIRRHEAATNEWIGPTHP